MSLANDTAAHAMPNDVGLLQGGVSEPYSSISCPSLGNCVTVGPLNSGVTGTDATVLSEVAGTWGTPTQLPLPVNADTTADDNEQSLNDVSCWSAGNCVTVGDFMVDTEL